MKQKQLEILWAKYIDKASPILGSVEPQDTVILLYHRDDLEISRDFRAVRVPGTTNWLKLSNFSSSAIFSKKSFDWIMVHYPRSNDNENALEICVQVGLGDPFTQEVLSELPLKKGLPFIILAQMLDMASRMDPSIRSNPSIPLTFNAA